MNIQTDKIKIKIEPELGRVIVTNGQTTWKMEEELSPYIQLVTGEKVLFSEFEKIQYSQFQSGVGEGVLCHYSGCFHRALQGFTFTTKIMIEESTEEILFELWPENDVEKSIDVIQWPQGFKLEGKNAKSYTVIPMMYGCMIPNNWPHAIEGITGNIFYERSGYMPWFGQVREGNGYIAIAETAYDAGYVLNHNVGGTTYIAPMWRPSMDKMRYRRIMRYRFFEQCDYVTMAKYYRNDVKARGELITLEEKIIKNPLLKQMQGTPVIHTDIYDHREPGCSIYDEENPENNDKVTSFERRLEQFETLKKQGVDRAYIHLDGWGQRGYDNLHPDVFPPCEQAGGTKGMKKLADRLKEMEYIFAIHDQYRDYYYDAETYRPEEAIQDKEGNIPEETMWAGGPQAYLCTQLAPKYVRRNFKWFEKNDILLQGAYLDVFSCMALDECYHPEHRMTREECAQKRGECLEYVRYLGKIVSSEECVDWSIKHLDLVHHSPIALTVELDGWNYSGPAIGIPIPLFTLVYHDCVVVPWFIQKGAWGIPEGQDGFLYGMLNGGTGYLNIEPSQNELKKNQQICQLNEKLFGTEMVSHTFLDGNYQKQKAVYDNGIEVEVDFEQDTYHIYSKGHL